MIQKVVLTPHQKNEIVHPSTDAAGLGVASRLVV
jgi:hypothetical protein